MPPSPTGLLHIGNARTMLFNYLFAKQNGGSIVLRIEDTDRERSKKEFEDDIKSSIEWLGLAYDDFARTSERGDLHKKALQKLIDSGHAYISKETPNEEGGRTEVIRFKNPNTSITFTDIIRGDVTFDTTELKDFVIAKSLEEPLYHLAVVVDDIDMGITHIIRGEDHISNTPRHILIMEALGATRPLYAHVPLVFAADRTKLSKRKHGEIVSLSYYRKLGYLPGAMVNFLAFLGWNPGDDRELFSLEELVREFKLEKVQKGAAAFNVEKLDWINSQYIKKLSDADFVANAKPFLSEKFSDRNITPLVPMLKERIAKFSDIKMLEEGGELEYFFWDPDVALESLVWKKSTKEKALLHLEKVHEMLSALSEKEFTIDGVKSALWSYAEAEGKGDVLWPLRIALSGKEKSPDPFTLASILGKEITLKRVQAAFIALKA